MPANAVLFLVGQIRVGGTEHLLDRAVVGAALVDVFDHEPDGRARGDAFENAGKDLHLIGLPTLGRVPGTAGGAAVEIRLQVGFRQGEAGRATVHHSPQRWPVAFAKGRHREKLSKRVPGHQSPLLDSEAN